MLRLIRQKGRAGANLGTQGKDAGQEYTYENRTIPTEFEEDVVRYCCFADLHYKAAMNVIHLCVPSTDYGNPT